jgi:hypothetical protein
MIQEKKEETEFDEERDRSERLQNHLEIDTDKDNRPTVFLVISSLIGAKLIV